MCLNIWSERMEAAKKKKSKFIIEWKPIAKRDLWLPRTRRQDKLHLQEAWLLHAWRNKKKVNTEKTFSFIAEEEGTIV
jgi:hypothetical protein